MTTSPVEQPQIPLSRFLRANFGRILLTILIFAGLGWLAGVVRSGTSVAEATILLQNPFSVEVFDPLRTDTGSDPELFVNDQIAYLESTDFAVEVASALDMPATADSAAEVLDQLSVNAMENSHLVELEFADETPESAVRGITTVVETYRQQVEASTTEPYQLALDALARGIGVSDESIDAMQSELTTLRDDKTQAIRVEFQGVLDQIQALREQLATATAAEVPPITAQINALATQAGLLQSQIAAASSDPELTALVGRLNDAITQQTVLANRRSELEVQLASAPSPVAAISLPTETAIVPPNVLSSAIAGALVGLVIGIGWAYWLSDPRRRRFIHKSEPRPILGTEFLGGIKLDPRRPLFSTTQPASREYRQFAEIHRKLVEGGPAGSHPRILGVASTGPDTTKSQVALNMALTGVRSGTKTLLIDADMENPNSSQILAGILGQPREIGYAEILGGLRDVTRTIQSVGIGDDKLHFIPSGKFNSLDTPKGGQLDGLLSALGEHYDLIVIDLPQHLESRVADHYASSGVDVVVAVRDRSSVYAAQQTRRRLDSAGAGQVGYLYTNRPGIFGR